MMRFGLVLVVLAAWVLLAPRLAYAEAVPDDLGVDVGDLAYPDRGVDGAIGDAADDHMPAGYDLTPMSSSALKAASRRLTEFQRWVLFEAGTERPHTNKYANHKGHGTYVSAVSGVPLFRSDDKYDSGSGWPSFTRPFHAAHVVEREDEDGSGRVEVVDAKSGTHLGHVFDDGPPPRKGGTGRRFCINSAALRFVPDSEHARAHADKGHAPGSQARENKTSKKREL